MTDDSGLERLLDLDELLVEVGAGFWVKIVAKRVPPSLAYSAVTPVPRLLTSSMKAGGQDHSRPTMTPIFGMVNSPV